MSCLNNRLFATTSILVVLLFSVLSTSAATGSVVLTTNFDALANGGVTAAALDGVTTGGTWNLNTARDANGFTIVDDGGNKAILADDDNGGNGGLIEFFTIDLTTPVAISPTSVATVEFTTATRRTGSSKALTFDFLDSSGVILSKLIWANSGALTLNAGGSQGSSPFFFTGAWDEDGTGVRDVSFSFDGVNTIMNFNGVTGTVPLSNASTDLASIRVSSDFGATAAKGVFFDDLEVSVVTVPEPGSLTLIAAAALGICGVRRRR